MFKTLPALWLASRNCAEYGLLGSRTEQPWSELSSKQEGIHMSVKSPSRGMTKDASRRQQKERLNNVKVRRRQLRGSGRDRTQRRTTGEECRSNLLAPLVPLLP